MITFEKVFDYKTSIKIGKYFLDGYNVIQIAKETGFNKDVLYRFRKKLIDNAAQHYKQSLFYNDFQTPIKSTRSSKEQYYEKESEIFAIPTEYKEEDLRVGSYEYNYLKQLKMKENVDKRKIIQEEASLAIRQNKFEGILVTAPRVGKTKIVIDALNKIKSSKKILVLAPRILIFKSWKKEILKWGLNSQIEITYCYSNSLKKNNEYYDLIVGDECHEYNLKVLALLRTRQKQGTKILGITGTLNEMNKFHYDNILGLNVFYEYSFAQAVKDGIVSDYQILCVGCDLDEKNKTFSGKTEKKEYDYWDTQYKDAVAKQKYSSLNFLMSKRLNIIYNSKTKLEKTKEILNLIDAKCLIFTGRVEIADQLGDASYHSKSESTNFEAFEKDKIQKLAVIGMVSMGVTIPNLKHVVFNQTQSSENDCIQKAMRTMNIEKGKVAQVYMIYLKNTQDEVWMRSAIEGFEKEKIKFI